MADDPNIPTADEPAGAIPPIDPNIAGSPDSHWVPPFLAQYGAGPSSTLAPQQLGETQGIPGEIQMPDDFVGQTQPLTPQAQVPGQPIGTPPFLQQQTPNLPPVPTDQQSAPPWLVQAQAGAGQAPMPQVDATSGGPAPADALNPQQAQDRYAAIATNPQTDLAERSKAWAAMTPDQQTNVLNTTDPKQLAALANDAMTPQQLATIQVRHQAAKLDEETTRLHQIYADNKARADAEAAAQAKAAAYADQETKKDAAAAAALVAKAKTDPNKRNFGQFISDVAMAGIGGAMSQFTGGKNLALESIQRRVEQNIQKQTEEISQGWKAIDLHKNSVASEYARHGDVIRAQSVARIAGLQEAKDALTTDMQNYDPQGTTAMNRAQVIQQINGVQQQAANQLHQQNLENGLKLAKAQTEAQTVVNADRHNRVDESQGWAKIGIEKDKAAAAKADQQLIPMDLLAARHPGIPLPPANMYPQGMSEKQLTQWSETNNKGLESQGKTTENAQKLAAGQVRDINGNPAVDDKGNPIQVEPKAAEHANNIRAKGQETLDSLSAARRMLASDPSTVDRATWAKIRGDLQNAGVTLAGTLGEKTSPRAIEETLKLVGDDYDSYTKRYLNRGEGGVGVQQIDNEIETLKRNLDTEVKTTTGVKTKAEFFDTSKPPPTKETPADKTDKLLTQNFGAADVDPTSLDADNRAFVEAAQKGVLARPSILKAGYAEDLGLSPLATRALHEGVAPVQLQALDQLEAAAIGGNDQARADAVEKLGVVAAKSKSAAVQAYAKALIEKADTAVTDDVMNPREGATARGGR